MSCVGDIHNIDGKLRDFDPNYFLWLSPYGKYQVMERQQMPVHEGELNGSPLFSFRENHVSVMTIDYIDPEKEAPDMRIVWYLQENDLHKYPGGAKRWYQDLENNTEKRKEKRKEATDDRISYQAKERHKYIVNEWDGLGTKTLFQGVNING